PHPLAATALLTYTTLFRSIAGVLAIKPEVLVLDEPTAGLDPRGQKDMMDMFYHMHKEEKLTTVLVTHSMEDAVKYADHVIILNRDRKSTRLNSSHVSISYA